MSKFKNNFPVKKSDNKVSVVDKSLVKKENIYQKDRQLALYLKEVSKYKLLNPEQEKALAIELYETGNIELAKELVQANLRLVVKIAMEYRNAYSQVMDLIQEGNIGLMKAVSKFDPYNGAKLSYYASWWIRSYILKFILDNFRLVKIGTTKEQKRLFFNLMKERDRLLAQGENPTTKMLSENLGVKEKTVIEMQQRLSSEGNEASLDMPISDDDKETLQNVIGSDYNLESEISSKQEKDILFDNLGNFLSTLKKRDKDIFQKRLIDDIPSSLQSIADEYGVSRERIRQIEERLLKNFKLYMSKFIR